MHRAYHATHIIGGAGLLGGGTLFGGMTASLWIEALLKAYPNLKDHCGTYIIDFGRFAHIMNITGACAAVFAMGVASEFVRNKLYDKIHEIRVKRHNIETSISVIDDLLSFLHYEQGFAAGYIEDLSKE